MANSLGGLGFATNQHSDTSGETQTSLQDCAGGGTSIKMSQFLWGEGVDDIHPSSLDVTYDSGEYYHNFELEFNGTVGSRFVSRVLSTVQNFSWWETCGKFIIFSDSVDQDYQIVARSDHDGGSNQFPRTGRLYCSYEDHYNGNESNWSQIDVDQGSPS